MSLRPALPKLANPKEHRSQTPTKQINEGDDLTFFFASKAYRDLSIWLLQLNLSMFPVQDDQGKFQESTLTASDPNIHSTAVKGLRELHTALSSLIDQAPPDTGPRRFGNAAFRKWYQLAEENAPKLLAEFLNSLPGFENRHHAELKQELQAYLMGSFGSAQRLDYGTGHELSYLAFLGCLWKLNAFQEGEERSIVTGLIQPYLELTRRLILLYSLEPAGSHGVWGLDDHHFIPYILGSAQLGPPITPSTPKAPTEASHPNAPPPSSVTDKPTVHALRSKNMYFSAIQFIYDVKRGPFWEHSPILYDISGLKDGWGKVNKGMLKMYAAEVLGKFPVVQHFPFGSLFQWERDPEAPVAAASAPSVHQREQPNSQPTSTAPAGGAGTKAPWAKPGGAAATAIPQMQASTGVPTTRAPWAPGARPAQPVVDSGASATAAPWARSNAASQQPPSTTSQWANRGPPR
ncbi:hypothetical protein MBLNU230_g3741t1 [Neophaeotheca triangularis]